MDRVGALARVAMLAAADKRPTLSTDDLDAILDAQRISDAYGRTITDPDWAPTWDLDQAVADAWDVKAARVAGDFNFSADDASFSKGDVLANCAAMAAQYRARGLRTLGAGADRVHPPYDATRLVVNG